MADFDPQHWADIIADRIIAEKGDKDLYVLASGITPSGTIHIGKFREIITTELVSRALVRKGKKVRFIYSWDDYDTFRKVPKNMPKQEMLKEMLYKPIVDIPDVYGTESSYARHNEVSLENVAPILGIKNIEFIYQSKIYRSGVYNEMIIKTADNAIKVKDILQKFKTGEIAADWFPIETYCSKCNRDRVLFSNYDTNLKTVDYECKLCGNKEKLDLKTSKKLKLPWRLDWPMRWAYEKVDFEPGGTDHSSAGGSYDTSKEIVKEIFEYNAPVYAKYAFVLPKGEKKKMSSSVGNVLSVENVLEIYTPQMVRWFFSSYKPEVPFNMAFDIDVLRNYENFDRMERIVYGIDGDNEEKRAAFRRVYEMSQIDPDEKLPELMPFQPVFRHLCTHLQINEMDIEKTRAAFADQIKNEVDEERFVERAKRAVFWLENYAPDDFIFTLNAEKRNDIKMTKSEARFILDLRKALESGDFNGEHELQNKIGDLIKSHGLDMRESYKLLYQLLASRDKGPKLANFILSIGPDRVLNLL